VSEAPALIWDDLYRRGKIPWRSSGLSEVARRLLKTYAAGPKLLEVGCGLGDDADGLIEAGFDYLGLDISTAAVGDADKRYSSESPQFARADFFHWAPADLFDVVYEKGVFHGLAGSRRRNTFVRRVAAMLPPGGIWVTVCGSADRRRADFTHGAIYLRDLIGPAELYFEVLEVVKAPYGLADKDHEFDAWHGAFRCR
jgi:cyclopropane fatty-acyl-phospholipid synthase-like methyltransferase